MYYSWYMKHDTLFTLLGLSHNEARVYRALLGLGQSSMSTVVQRTKNYIVRLPIAR